MAEWLVAELTDLGVGDAACLLGEWASGRGPVPAAMFASRNVADWVVVLAAVSAATSGGPFAALVTRPVGDGGVVVPVAAGVNVVTRTPDPTAHGEVTAIRRAAALVGADLSGLSLTTSCEPCPMCFGACLWARLDRVDLVVSAADASAAGFDDSPFWDRVRGYPAAAGDGTGFRSVEAAAVPAVLPFTVWAQNPNQVTY